LLAAELLSFEARFHPPFSLSRQKPFGLVCRPAA